MFVLAYARGNNVADEDSYRRYFLPSSDIKNYNIEIDGKIFMIKQLMTQLSNMTKLEIYQRDKVMITQMVVY